MEQNALIEWTVPCKNLATALDFYTRELGFRIDTIFPADAPRVAQISGCGTHIRLQQCDAAAPCSLRLILVSSTTEEQKALVSPDGTRIEWVSSLPELKLPALQARAVVNSLAQGEHPWGTGRAGMQYRDLLPDRQGGALIASHIRIPEGGPVPDYVHHHLVLFQLIYCAKGWVRVVYEDQGPEFVLREGDCVLQPPGIRHRVLESSAGMEVIEIGSPAEHMTFVDHELSLPTTILNSEREFGGQSFVRHRAINGKWQREAGSGFELRDIGLTDASKGVISLHALRNPGQDVKQTQAIQQHVDGCLQFFFVLRGNIEIELDQQVQQLAGNDSFLVPGGQSWVIHHRSADLELLRLTMHDYPQ